MENMSINNEKKVTCFLPCSNRDNLALTIKELEQFKEIGSIFIICPNNVEKLYAKSLPYGCQILSTGFLQQTQSWKEIVPPIDTPYTLLYTNSLPLKLGAYAIERMLNVISDTGAGMLYADRYKMKEGLLQPHPVNDYQEGSLRDDFDFGSLLLFQSSVLKELLSEYPTAIIPFDTVLTALKLSMLFPPKLYFNIMLFSDTE